MSKYSKTTLTTLMATFLIGASGFFGYYLSEYWGDEKEIETEVFQQKKIFQISKQQ